VIEVSFIDIIFIYVHLYIWWLIPVMTGSCVFL